MVLTVPKKEYRFYLSVHIETARSIPDEEGNKRKEILFMRKNKMMRAASGLLVATLLTTSVISGTFAKYTTSATGTDTARVAKWGVEITANGSTFATEYETDDETSKTAIAKSVIGTGAEDKDKEVVAPGTKGEMAKMTLTGTPEVAVKVSYTGAFALDDNWKVGDDFYCPLIITVKSNTGTTTIKQNDTVNTKEAFNNAVNAAIAAYSKEYAPGTNLSEKGDDSLTVTWEWPFDDADNSGANDEKDTALGNAANAANAATVKLEVTTTVTQID